MQEFRLSRKAPLNHPETAKKNAVCLGKTNKKQILLLKKRALKHLFQNYNKTNPAVKEEAQGYVVKVPSAAIL